MSDIAWMNNVYGVTTQSGTTSPVIVSDSGQLGTVAAAERFKKDIVTMDKTSENILLLRPVTFQYKSDIKQISQFGLIAEEVADLNQANTPSFPARFFLSQIKFNLDEHARSLQDSRAMKMIVRLLPLVLTLLWLPLTAHRSHAVIPPPDGGYPGFNTAEGQNALFSLGTGVANTAVGWRSLQSDTDGSYNTAVGAGTLLFNASGNSNIAIGAAALLFNAAGTENTAVGVAALLNNDSTGTGVGSFNSAFGAHALQNNTDGQANSAFGNSALSSNTSGFTNTAIGLGALLNNTEGSNNTAIGFDSLLSNTLGNQNTATGWNALYFNTVGHFNTANGLNALVANTEGLSNTGLGWGALLTNTTGGNNTAIGVRAGQDITGNFNICIGSQVNGVAGESNRIRIGDNLPAQTEESSCYIGGIHNQVAVNGLTVLVNSTGKLGTAVSSRRFKEEIEPLDKNSESLFALRPVSFRYKKEIDPAGVRQFGLVAEEVEKVNPDLVGRDLEGKPTAVRYDQINAMLLNEFLKEHRKNDEQASTIARLEQKVEALTAGLHKVSAQLAAASPSLADAR